MLFPFFAYGLNKSQVACPAELSQDIMILNLK